MQHFTSGILKHQLEGASPALLSGHMPSRLPAPQALQLLDSLLLQHFQPSSMEVGTT